MANNLGYYHIPSGLPKEVSEIIINQYLREEFEDSTVYSNKKTQLIDEKTRKSRNIWLETDSWVAGMMSHFIHSANNEYFNYDLEQWADGIQYTVYEGKGSHYTWHYDTSESSFGKDKKLIRKLSITLLLSSKNDFEGGQFQIMVDNNKMQTVDMDVGDVIIFPSDALHRVRPLKSGKRISLVGWYAGPPLR